MKALTVEFDPNIENDYGLAIKNVRVEMNAAELALVLSLVGKMKQNDIESVSFEGGARAANAVYRTLASLVNSQYEDGLTDLVQQVR